MKSDEIDINDLDQMRKATKESAEKIKNSALFLTLITENFFRDPIAMIQLGLAIMLDKPIVIVTVDNTAVPKHLALIAKSIHKFENTKELDEGIRKILNET